MKFLLLCLHLIWEVLRESDFCNEDRRPLICRVLPCDLNVLLLFIEQNEAGAHFVVRRAYDRAIVYIPTVRKGLRFSTGLFTLDVKAMSSTGGADSISRHRSILMHWNFSAASESYGFFFEANA